MLNSEDVHENRTQRFGYHGNVLCTNLRYDWLRAVIFRPKVNKSGRVERVLQFLQRCKKIGRTIGWKTTKISEMVRLTCACMVRYGMVFEYLYSAPQHPWANRGALVRLAQRKEIGLSFKNLVIRKYRKIG